MSLTLRLTRAAQTSLINIALWTIETFGLKQADAYQADLLEACQAIAEGEAQARDCRSLIDPDLPEDLKFTRCGEHYIVFVSYPEQVTILDFIHVRTDLPARLASLAKSIPI
jgi:plasmid stabilization system protein ParE